MGLSWWDIVGFNFKNATSETSPLVANLTQEEVDMINEHNQLDNFLYSQVCRKDTARGRKSGRKGEKGSILARKFILPHFRQSLSQFYSFPMPTNDRPSDALNDT